MNIVDETWTRKLLYRHYQKHRRGVARPDTETLVMLRREQWRRDRMQLAHEIEKLIPTVLTPPESEREQDHETLTVFDAMRTISGALR